MLSYQHAYHAGGPADLHKHMILAELLAALTTKPRGISYAETHAGRGLYRTDSAEAQKTGEAAQGIARLEPGGDTPYGRALASFREEHGANAYPGSPLLAQRILRDADRMTLMELHPAEHAALRRCATANVSIHHRDGFEGVLALAPLTPRKGLVLVDPSYEVKSEYAQAADFTRCLITKWPQASVMIWYPLLPAARHRDLLNGLHPLPVLRDEVVFTPPPERGMSGSGAALINAPHGFTKALPRIHAQASGIFEPRKVRR